MSDAHELQEHTQHIYEAEKIAYAITSLRAKKIALDKRRQHNRQALNAIRRQKSSDDIESDQVYYDFSQSIVSLDIDVVEKHLLNSQIEIEQQLEQATHDLKALVGELQDIAPSQGIDPDSLKFMLAE